MKFLSENQFCFTTFCSNDFLWLCAECNGFRWWICRWSWDLWKVLLKGEKVFLIKKLTVMIMTFGLASGNDGWSESLRIFQCLKWFLILVELFCLKGKKLVKWLDWNVASFGFTSEINERHKTQRFVGKFWKYSRYICARPIYQKFVTKSRIQ